MIVVLLFGTKRLKNIGSDLGNAVKGFRGAMTEGEKDKKEEEQAPEQLEQADEEAKTTAQNEVKSNDKESA